MTISLETFKPTLGLNIHVLVSPFKILGNQRGDRQANGTFGEQTVFDDTAFTELPYKSIKTNVLVRSAEKVRRVFSAQELQTLRTDLLILFHNAKEKVFKDGMESAFSRQLLAILKDYGDMAMNQINLLVEEDRIPHGVLAEALRWFGQMDDEATYPHRRWLLEYCLRHQSAQVRDGAILGLSFLEDPRVIPALERAMTQELHQTLSSDIAQVLEDLREMLP